MIKYMYQLLFVTWMSTNQFYRQICYVLCSVYLIPHYLTKADQFIWETLVNCAHSSLSNSVPCSWPEVYYAREITTWARPWGMRTFSGRYGFTEASMMWCLIGIIPLILRRHQYLLAACRQHWSPLWTLHNYATASHLFSISSILRWW